MSYTLLFEYDKRGKGSLILLKCGSNAGEWLCRTGYINHQDTLLNAVKQGMHEIKSINDPILLEIEINGQGWKDKLDGIIKEQKRIFLNVGTK